MSRDVCPVCRRPSTPEAGSLQASPVIGWVDDPALGLCEVTVETDRRGWYAKVHGEPGRCSPFYTFPADAYAAAVRMVVG